MGGGNFSTCRIGQKSCPRDIMSKDPKKLKFRLPCYVSPRNSWRRKINAAALAARAKRGIVYGTSDHLRVAVRLYMPNAKLASNDLDNRLKDILDALQGRAGGTKAKRTLPAIIPNDNQVFRVEMEKAKPPKQSRGLGHVTIDKLRREG